MNTISYNRFMNDLLGAAARRHGTPCFGSFELTPLCNLDCKMCYVHRSDPAVRARMLSGDQWIALMDEAIGQGMIVALLTGGEAFTHPDFRRVYMHLIQRGVSVRLKTNGVLLNEEMIRWLQDYPPYSVDVSLYGCDGASYRAVTGHDVFAAVSENVRAAVGAGLHLRLAVTPSAYMLPWVDGVLDFAKTFGLPVMVNDLLVEPAPETGRAGQAGRVDLAETERIQRRAAELFPRTLRFQEEDEMRGNEAEAVFSPRGLACNAGRNSFAVSWDGTLRPCLNFPPALISARPLETGFAAAWQAVNRAVREYALPEMCASCAYHSLCHYCPSLHSRFAPGCDPEVCAWRRRQADQDIGNV